MDFLTFIIRKHVSQRRKYTGEIYVAHLLEVAAITAEYAHHYLEHVREVMIMVALGHDCMEDQGVTFEELEANFGYTIAHGIHLLSDLDEGNRAIRNAKSKERLAAAPGWVQTVKCADLISNTRSIVQHDPGFAIPYLAEKRALLEVLTHAHPEIHKRATAMAVCPLCGNEGFTRSLAGIKKCRCTSVYSA
jgi:(p)ppGpp synthase/HD superfamily hydrolase